MPTEDGEVKWDRTSAQDFDASNQGIGGFQAGVGGLHRVVREGEVSSCFDPGGEDVQQGEVHHLQEHIFSKRDQLREGHDRGVRKEAARHF